MRCKQFEVDPAMFSKFNKEGNSDLKESVEKKLGEIFQMGKTEVKQFQYVGYLFDQKEIC